MNDFTERFVDDAEATQITSLSRSQRHRMTRQGLFPKKRQITIGRSAYLLSELRRWVSDRIAASERAA